MSTELEGTQTAVRSSGRVRKAPETLYDNVESNNKRKRNGARVSGEAEEDDSEEESEEEEDESDEDETHKPKGRNTKRISNGRPSQKKAKTNDIATLALRPAAKKRGPRTLIGLDAQDAGLFTEIFAERKESQEVVSQWLGRFEEHESRALAEIINLVLRASGCTSEVTEQDVEDVDAVTNRVADLQEEYQASNPTEYPFMKGRVASTIKQGIDDFFDAFFKSIASNGVLYESPALAENIATWFTALASAAHRALRHTATTISLMIMKSFCEIAREAGNNAAKIVRQAESEKKKAGKNKARVADIESRAKEARQRQEYVEALQIDWYDTVFLHRYKDVDAAIRRECAAALGDWIIILPSLHLDGHHLRYLGWMFSDAIVSVRLEAVKQLLRFYKVPDMVGGLKAFTEKFRPRLVEMATSDADVSVRTAAVELLDQMRENGLLEAEDIDAVGRMIYDSDDKVRRATAAFLAEGVTELYDAKVDELGGKEALDDVLPEIAADDYDSPRLSWLTLKSVAETLQAYHTEETLPKGIERPRAQGGLLLNVDAVESRFALAATDLYEHIVQLSEWKVIAGLLLADAKPARRKKSADTLAKLRTACSLSHKEELIMLEMLSVSISQQVDQYERYLSDKSKGTKKSRSDLQDETEETATHLLFILPRLLEKYGEAPDTVKLVLNLLQVLDRDLFKQIGRDSSVYSSLLEKVKQQFMSHTNDEVLGSATKTILNATQHTELDEVANEQLAALWEEIATNFIHLLNFDLQKRGSASGDVLAALRDNLHRILRLVQISDPAAVLENESDIESLKLGDTIKAPIDCILALMDRAKPATNISNSIAVLEDQIATIAAEIILFYFQWRLASIKQRVEGPNGAEIPFEELEALATRRDAYSDALSVVLQSRRAHDEICASFAGTMLELHTASATLENVQRNDTISDDYMVLNIELYKEKQKEIMKAFIGAETVFASLSGRKLENAAISEDQVDDVEADPLSDSEDDEELDEAESAESQQKKERKMIATLLAEQRLCQLASKIVYAVLAGVMDKRPVRQRFERNKAKLGANFKAVCEFFDMGKTKAKKGKPVVDGANGVKKAAKNAKSNAIVAESEDEDEIEDVDDDPQALLRRELVDVDEIAGANDNGDAMEL